MGVGRGHSSSGKEEVTDRGNWDNQCDFFLSCLGYAVGLGNVWRFPYLCYEHGGGSFLVAYGTMLLLAGLPLFFLELSLGQYAGLGPHKVFGRLAPAFKGLGVAMLFVTFLVAIYYNMIIAWTLFFVFAGFRSELPWKSCGQQFNTRDCFDKEMAQDCDREHGEDGLWSFWDNKCSQVEDICKFYNFTHAPGSRDVNNFTMCYNNTNLLPLHKAYKRTPPSADYYKFVLLGLEEDTTWSNYGGLQWELVLCLLGAWVIVGLCLIKGVKSSGKVVYFTALFPYVILLILLIKGLTLDGAMKGIEFYTTPHFETLGSVKVWSDAATQIFYSLGPAFGGLITLASYNRFDNNCHRDAILIAFSNCGTSVFAGFVIFSIIGFMADDLGADVADVIADGPGLAFIAYPAALVRLPWAPVWSFLFFTMLITLGLDSQFTMVETLTSAVLDQYPHLRSKKSLVVALASFLGLLLGLPMCCKGGVYFFTLIDWFAASWSLLLLALSELILVVYIYGRENFLDNIWDMGIRIPRVLQFSWQVNWLFFSPLILLCITVITWIKFTPCSYAGYVFPDEVQFCGWLMASSSVGIFLVTGLYQALVVPRRTGSWRNLFTPEADWGPAVAATATATFTSTEPVQMNGAGLSSKGPEAFANQAYTHDNGIVSSHL